MSLSSRIETSAVTVVAADDYLAEDHDEDRRTGFLITDLDSVLWDARRYRWSGTQAQLLASNSAAVC